MRYIDYFVIVDMFPVIYSDASYTAPNLMFVVYIHSP